MVEHFFKISMTLLGAVFGYLYGGWSILLQVVLVFTVADYITGLAASGVEGRLSSNVGFRGIIKKMLIWVVIAVAHMVDKLLGQGDMIMDACCFFYLANEGLSILENCGRAGLPTPALLKKAILILRDKGDNSNDK